MACLSVDILQQLPSPVAHSPPFAINTEYDSVLITSGYKFSSVLQFNSHEYIKVSRLIC